MKTEPCQTIDEYIEQFDSEIQQKLEQLRKTILEQAPSVSECISYQMPTFKLYGKALVHFACQKAHIGFYPTPSPILAFSDKLKDYKTSKGAIQFKLSEELPLELIKEIVKFRVAEVTEKQKSKIN